MSTLSSPSQPMSKPRAVQSNWRRPAYARPVHVVMDGAAPDALSATPLRVELEATWPHDSSLWPEWTTRDAIAWEEVIAAASGYPELVLTAELGNDADAKHLVFALAERLARTIGPTRPLVRILFLPKACNHRRHS